MRSYWLTLAMPLFLLACSSSTQGASSGDASMVAPDDDGSAAGCTNLGGMCVPYTTTCPLPQQNATLCGDTVMLCCLPVGSAPPVANPDSGVVPVPVDDSGGGPPPADGSADAPNG